MTTATMTLTAIYGSASAVKAGGEKVMIQATPLDANGQPSGSVVRVDSADESIASLTSAEQLGNSPLGIVGNSPGTVLMTATCADGSGVTATLSVTVV